MNKPFYGEEYGEVWHLCLKSTKPNVPVIIENIGITFPNAKISVTRENHDIYVVEYILKGKEHLIVDGKEYTLEKGDLVILEPKIAHRYYSDKKDPCEKKWINFKSESFGFLYQKLGLNGKVVYKNTTTREFFDVLLSIAETSLYSDDICYDVATTLFTLLTTVAKDLNREKDKNISTIARIVKEKLDNSIFSRINLDEICEETYYSKKQITREFKKYYKDTPYNYLISIKIAMAKRLLRNSDLSIKEIAYKLCFDNQHYFSNAFKKKTNLSPTEYREKR